MWRWKPFLFSSFDILFAFLFSLQESTVQSTVHQRPLKIQNQIDCAELRMESHVAGEGGTITRPHLLTLTLRYWTTAALSVYLTGKAVIEFITIQILLIMQKCQFCSLLYLKNNASTCLKCAFTCSILHVTTCKCPKQSFFLVKALFCMLRFACKHLNRHSGGLFSVHITCFDMKTKEKTDHFKSLINSFLAWLSFYNEQNQQISDNCQH